jgi:hypothetical protein
VHLILSTVLYGPFYPASTDKTRRNVLRQLCQMWQAESHTLDFIVIVHVYAERMKQKTGE